MASRESETSMHQRAPIRLPSQLWILFFTIFIGISPNSCSAFLPHSKQAFVVQSKVKLKSAVDTYLKSTKCDEPYRVEFELANLDGKKGNDGNFVLEIRPEWAPLGAARMKEMFDENFFKDIRFFRVIPGFMAQFGIHGNPETSSKWRSRTLKDDPVLQSNTRGFISFATAGPHSRTTQMFINFGDNSNLDGMGFAPFGKVVKGMDVVDRIYQIGEKPDQGQIQYMGNQYLDSQFPQLTYIKSNPKVVAAEKKDL